MMLLTANSWNQVLLVTLLIPISTLRSVSLVVEEVSAGLLAKGVQKHQPATTGKQGVGMPIVSNEENRCEHFAREVIQLIISHVMPAV
eukprot:scaffold925_cov17-Tisochrysis_lutea.AAC.1